MSKNRIMALSLILIFLIQLTAGTAWAAPVKAVSLKFTEGSISLAKGGKMDLNTKLKRSAKVTVVFTTSNAKVASVTSAGVVTGIVSGKATITASVSQKGYSGKASIAVQVTAPATSGGLNTGAAAKPVIYTDLALLDADIRQGLKTLFKKDYTKLTADETAQRDKLMNIDRQQLLAGLQAIIVKGEPSWSATMAQEFAVHNLEGNIKDIAALFSAAVNDQDSRRAALELLKAFKSDNALKSFGNLLMYSPDANLRYSVAYLISQFKGNTEALSLLINATIIETDDKTWINEAASLIVVAGTDTGMINTVILTYGQYPDARKSKFAGCFGYDDPARAELFKTWETTLNDNLQSPVDALKNASSTLWNDLKKYPRD
ncbi:Ig domain-containing protein [Paenibacillus sp. sgz500958]|uniref:Ig-like domain-containing protein n=1 Tax=Paenibacillus sp. sgz500958 TaxID=3242475 RepID=UPI0036D41282